MKIEIQNSTNDKIYVVKSANSYLRNIKVLDYIMDYNKNIICWRNKKNLEQYLEETGFIDKGIIVETTVNDIKKELEIKKNDLKNIKIGIRVIDGIYFSST